MQGFADECNGKGKSVADGREGRKSLILSNAMYLSSWEKRMVDIPDIGSGKELLFEEEFERELNKRIASAKG